MRLIEEDFKLARGELKATLHSPLMGAAILHGDVETSTVGWVLAYLEAFLYNTTH